MTLAPLLPRSAHKVRPIKVLIQEGLGFARGGFGNGAGGDLLAARDQNVANAGSFGQERDVIDHGQGLARFGQALSKSKKQRPRVFERHNTGTSVVLAARGDVNLAAAQLALYERVEQYMRGMLCAVRKFAFGHPVTPLVFFSPPKGTLTGEIADETVRCGTPCGFPQIVRYRVRLTQTGERGQG